MALWIRMVLQWKHWMNFLLFWGNVGLKTDDSVVFSVGTFMTEWFIWPVSIYRQVVAAQSPSVVGTTPSKKPTYTTRKHQRFYLSSWSIVLDNFWSHSPGSIQMDKVKKKGWIWCLLLMLIHTVIAKSILWDRKKIVRTIYHVNNLKIQYKTQSFKNILEMQQK